MAGHNHQSQSPGLSQMNLHWSDAAESPTPLVWPCHLDRWWALAKVIVLWWTSTRTMKTRLAKKALQRHTEEQPEVVWHQTFWTQCSSPGLPPLVCAHVCSKCIAGKRVTSRTACSPWSSPQSCFCPCHNNGLPVFHLPLTLQIQTGAAEPFQSPLTGAQTKSSLNARNNNQTPNFTAVLFKNMQWTLKYKCIFVVYSFILYLQWQRILRYSCYWYFQSTNKFFIVSAICGHPWGVPFAPQGQ